MQNWSAALLAGSLQLLLAQLFLRRHDGLLAKCIRRWPFKPLFTRSLKLDSRLIPAFVHHSHRRHSGAQRHWDVLRSHVLEQGRAKRSREAQHNKGETSRETLRKTVHQHVRYHKESQADDLQYFLTSFKKSQFVSHRRTESNFVRGNLDPLRELPPAYPPERAPCTYSQVMLRKVLFLQPHIREAALDSCGVAFNSGALGALCWFLATQEGDEVSEGFAVVLHMASMFAEEILANFMFFPAFLLLGLLTFIVNRWQEFLVTCHTVQARLHDIGVCMGMAVIDPDDQETRRLLFQLYRYLNVVHGLTYQNVHPQMPQTPNGFVYLGLLKETEASILMNCGNKQRDCVVAWCGGVMEEMARKELVAPCFTYAPMIAGLRGITAKHHDGFVRNMPNTWYAVGRLLADSLVYLQLVALPLKLHRLPSSEIWDSTSSDVWSYWMLVIFCLVVVAGGFVVSCAYWLPWSMIGVLLNPFGTGVDAYNTDALLASTDRMLFVSMRALFDTKSPPPKNSQRSSRSIYDMLTPPERSTREPNVGPADDLPVSI